MDEESRDRRITGALAIALLAYYLLTLGGHHYSSDGIIMFQSAKRLLFARSFVLDPPVRWETDVRVSIYGIGMTLAYVPLLVLWWPVFARWPSLQAIPYDPSLIRNPSLYANLPYVLCSALNPIITAATGALVFRMGRMLGLSPAWALVAAGIYAVASPAAAYARYDFSQPLAGLALTGAAWALLRGQRSGGPGPWLGAGACLGWGLLTRPEVLAIVPWVLAWTWWRSRSEKASVLATRVAGVIAPVAVAALAYVAISAAKFGATGSLGYAPTRLFAIGNLVAGVPGLLLSPVRGLLVFFPLSVLAVPGLWRLRKQEPGAATLFAGLLGVTLLVYGSFAYWSGGWSWGPRFLVPVLPFIALAATAWAAAAPGPGLGPRRAGFCVLALLGLVVSWNGILVDFVEHHRWVTKTLGVLDSRQNPFLLAASPLVTGWFEPPDTPLDLFWLRALDGHQVQTYGKLLGPALGWVGGSVPLLAALSCLVLLAIIAGATRRLWRLLDVEASIAPAERRLASAEASADSSEAFWAGVGTSFPSLKGAASTAYYFECERGLLEQFFPDLAGRSLLKTDLWDEAKNTEILKWAAERGARPVGVDIAFDIVSSARAILAPHRPACVAGDVRALPFASQSLDLIYSMGTIEHSADYEAAAGEILRVLKPRGIAIIGVPNKLDPFLRPLLVDVLNRCGLYAYGFEKSFTPRQLRRLLERVGFRVEAQTGILFMPGWLRMMDLWCHTRASPLVALTALLVRGFAWLYREVPAVRRHGYLTVCVVTREAPITPAAGRASMVTSGMRALEPPQGWTGLAMGSNS